MVPEMLTIAGRNQQNFSKKLAETFIYQDFDRIYPNVWLVDIFFSYRGNHILVASRLLIYLIKRLVRLGLGNNLLKYKKEGTILVEERTVPCIISC